MKLPFTKMHGLGNDFVVFDATRQPLSLTPAQIRALADRHFGIGCDQVLLVEASDQPDVDFRYRIFNADGGEVEQCGNGARCFARFVHDRGLTDRRAIRVMTNTGLITLLLEDDGQVTVDMDKPRLDPPAIPFLADAQANHYCLQVGDETLTVGVVSMGNPHVVLTVPQIATAPVARLGPLLESHPRFPNRVNVGFMNVVSREHLRLRVYERGVGETLACGTGACAAVVVGHLQHTLADNVRVDLPGGSLRIHWPGGDATVRMTGPAVSVFDGWITL